MPDKFMQAVEELLRIEGGYAFDPHDPGGETNWGICRRQYPHLDIKNLSRDEAIAIYRRDWWERYDYERIDYPPFATKVFILAINMGQGHAVKCLQRAVNDAGAHIGRLRIDGILGPKTLAAVNDQRIWLHAGRCGLVLALVKIEATKHYLRIGNWRYLSGWIRRALL